MRLIPLLLLLPTLAAAEVFAPMTGAEIEEALNETTLVYEGGEVQTFYASGRTLYNNGRPSWGYWAVRGDAYCSQWPPSDSWECYTMDRDADVLRFIAASGHIDAGTIRE